MLEMREVAKNIYGREVGSGMRVEYNSKKTEQRRKHEEYCTK